MRETLNAAIRGVLEGAAAGGAVPGAVAVVVDRDGTQGLAAGGTTRIDGAGVPLEEGTPFRVASMTKALATVAALQLVEQGRVALDDPVASVLPAWDALQVLDGFDGDQPRLRPPASAATIRQLMCHTAGHGYLFFNSDLARYHELSGAPTVFTGLKASLDTPLQSDPGTRWEYGINTDWLGLVVEELSGQPLDEYLIEHLFDPLGMAATTFTPTPEQRAAMMPVHMRTPDGGFAVTDMDLAPEPEWMAGGHGVTSTAEDYGRFIAMLLRGGTAPDGTPVLGTGLVDEAFRDQLGDLRYPPVIETAVPDISNCGCQLARSPNMGPRVPPHAGGPARYAARGNGRLGWNLQLLLLGRPSHRRRRRVFHPGAAVLRPTLRRDSGRCRAGRVRRVQSRRPVEIHSCPWPHRPVPRTSTTSRENTGRPRSNCGSRDSQQIDAERSLTRPPPRPPRPPRTTERDDECPRTSAHFAAEGGRERRIVGPAGHGAVRRHRTSPSTSSSEAGRLRGADSAISPRATGHARQ